MVFSQASYMDTHLSYGVWCAIALIHQGEVDPKRYGGAPARGQNVMYAMGSRRQLHYLCHWSAYFAMHGYLNCSFREDFGPFPRVTRYQDQGCLGLFLLE
ncbi:hypothetical protein KP509_17G038800 [Ceratopteris richardii]|uniref:Uncharacterized protein n=1 Tax=Ceratopteris richardii TaxID=49495 RepID=A0A8T2SV69_CERRI|nr:hypothetical protein KP509_17G038800 [Ceratopteris richardii]